MLVIVQSDNGKMTSLVNVTNVTPLVLAVPDQTTSNAVVVMNQDTYKTDIVLTHVLYLVIILMMLKELANLVKLLVKNVSDLMLETVLCVQLVLGY